MKVTLVDTGLNTMTGSRIKRIEPYIGNNSFMLTYGDGLADINIQKLVDCHKSGGKLATITAVQPDGRFGRLELEGDQVIGFTEKVRGMVVGLTVDLWFVNLKFSITFRIKTQ